MVSRVSRAGIAPKAKAEAPSAGVARTSFEMKEL